MSNWRSIAQGKSPEERFWQRVEKQGPDDCWEWQAGTGDYGYGRFWVDGKVATSHRFSWELHSGAIPDDKCVCHHCDNPKCVNPKHLYIGTHADNMADKKERGRAGNYLGDQSGANNNQAKLTEIQVRVIRNYLKAGITQQSLADSFGLKQVTISDINRRKTWSHI